MGDGIYTIGVNGWNNQGKSTWGKYQYYIKYENVAILRVNNAFAAAFVSIYDQLQVKFGGERFQFDGIMAPGYDS